MRRIYILLIAIVILAAGFRIYRLDSIPPSLSWDEAAVGYNAYTIANWGKDEYGKIFPLYFRSFGEDKQPIHIYTTAIFVKLFGLSEFSTRISAAIFGSLNVLMIFFLARIMFGSSLVGLLSSLLLAVSPQNIFFSRFNHEANFALFFFMLGLLLFYKAIKTGKNLLPFSFLAFLLSVISYHAAEIVVPLVLFLLLILYPKDIFKRKISLLMIFILLAGFIMLSIINPRLLGVARYEQTVQGLNDVEKTGTFKNTNNYLLGRIDLVLTQYSWHFSTQFLFESGDKNPRLSSQGSGEFYKIDAIFLFLGVVYLIYKKSKTSLLIFGWALIGPLPSSLFGEAPHAGRAAFMMGSWQIISALGFYTLIKLLKPPLLKWVIGSVCIIILFFSAASYLNYYFNEFPKRFAIDWQYGMKQTVEYVSGYPEYPQIYMTDVRDQPYIFFLYYLKTALPEYLNSVMYNNSESKRRNNVSYFGKYAFGGWSAIESTAIKRVLYVLSPSEYDGLQYRSDFDIKKIIYYPNGSTAFFLVALK